MIVYEFDKLKSKIIEKLNEKKGVLWVDEPLTLIDWFFNTMIQNELWWGIRIWGPTVPMIWLVWQKSGRVYFFALKALLPNIDSQDA